MWWTNFNFKTPLKITRDAIWVTNPLTTTFQLFFFYRKCINFKWSIFFPFFFPANSTIPFYLPLHPNLALNRDSRYYNRRKFLYLKWVKISCEFLLFSKYLRVSIIHFCLKYHFDGSLWVLLKNTTTIIKCIIVISIIFFFWLKIRFSFNNQRYINQLKV